MIDQSASQVLEMFLGVTLPEDFRKFILLNTFDKSGKAFPSQSVGDLTVDYFFPLIGQKEDCIATKLKLYAGRVPDEMLPIARFSGGDLLLLTLKGKGRGEVSFWDHEMEADNENQPYYKNITNLSKSFSEFYSQLI